MSACLTERKWATARRLHRSAGMACPCRLTARPCPRPDGYSDHGPLLRSLGADDASLWLAETGQPTAWVSQPYGLDEDDLVALGAYAADHGLHLRIEAEQSWHFPGRSLFVELSRANRASAPVGTFCARLAQHGQDRNARGDLGP